MITIQTEHEQRTTVACLRETGGNTVKRSECGLTASDLQHALTFLEHYWEDDQWAKDNFDNTWELLEYVGIEYNSQRNTGMKGTGLAPSATAAWAQLSKKDVIFELKRIGQCGTTLLKYLKDELYSDFFTIGIKYDGPIDCEANPFPAPKAEQQPDRGDVKSGRFKLSPSAHPSVSE